MTRLVTKTAFTTGLLLMLMAIPVYAASVNKSVKIAAGTTSDGASSVNGSITIGESAIVTGGVKTVNGTIRVAAGAMIENASTVNGGVKISDNVQSKNLNTVNGTISVGRSANVDGEVGAVNGRIEVARGATVASDLKNVNGQIELSGAEIGGDVSTVSGDIDVVDGSVVKGDLIVEKPGGWNSGKRRKPRIVIGPGSSVRGVIDLEQEVELFISDTAEVGGVKGVMNMDQAVRFSGERP